MKEKILSTPLSQHFPALVSSDGAGEKYYFDSAATACTVGPVIEAMTAFYEQARGSVHRGVYESAERTTSHFEAVRQDVAEFINAQSSSEIIFTAGATDSLNTVAYVWAQHILEPGDGIIITQAEHHAHYVLWHEVARRLGAHVYVLPIDSETYCVDISALDHLLTKSIKVFAATTSSNVLGPVWGVGDVLLHRAIAKVRALGVGVVLDVAQTIAHQPINVEKLDCDFLAFSVHKMGGPTGLGILYAHKRMHDQMKPYRFGGGMVAAVTSEFMTWQAAPHCYEAGTPPIAQVVGLGALLKFYKEQVDFPELKETEAAFCSQLICGLKNIPGLHIVGNADLLSREGHVVSFYLDDIHAHDLASSLGQYGCAVRAGDHCAQPLSALWDKKATVRVSFFMYNSSAQVQYLICAIERCVAQWRKLL